MKEEQEPSENIKYEKYNEWDRGTDAGQNQLVGASSQGRLPKGSRKWSEETHTHTQSSPAVE